jgi:hypothetical protein
MNVLNIKFALRAIQMILENFIMGNVYLYKDIMIQVIKRLKNVQICAKVALIVPLSVLYVKMRIII